MTFPSDIAIDQRQAHAFAGGLAAVARSEGEIDPREKSILDGLGLGDVATLTSPSPEELADALGRGTEAATLFLRTALLMAWADGTAGKDERALIGRFAAALGVAEGDLVGLEQSVKEYLLAPFARLVNTPAAVEVAKKLSV